MRGQALLAAGVMAMTVGFMAPAANAQSYQGGPAYGYNGPVDPNCKQRKTSNGVVGALVGGALGVVLGHNVYARAHKHDGRIVGGLAGAGLGAAIGAGGTNCAAGAAYGGPYNDSYASAPPPVAAPPPAPPPSYGDRGYNNRGGYNDRYEDELAGGPSDRYGPPPRVYAEGRRYASSCRVVEELRRDRYGRPYRVPTQVCRDPYSGEWVVTR